MSEACNNEVKIKREMKRKILYGALHHWCNQNRQALYIDSATNIPIKKLANKIGILPGTLQRFLDYDPTVPMTSLLIIEHWVEIQKERIQ